MTPPLIYRLLFFHLIDAPIIYRKKFIRYYHITLLLNSIGTSARYYILDFVE